MRKLSNWLEWWHKITTEAMRTGDPVLRGSFETLCSSVLASNFLARKSACPWRRPTQPRLNFLSATIGHPSKPLRRARSTSANFDFFFRVRPIRLRPISTLANFDFGQFFDVEFLDHKRWDPERVGPRKGGAPKGGAPKSGTRRVGPKFRSFFPSPAPTFALFISLWMSSR